MPFILLSANDTNNKIKVFITSIFLLQVQFYNQSGYLQSTALLTHNLIIAHYFYIKIIENILYLIRCLKIIYWLHNINNIYGFFNNINNVLKRFICHWCLV